MQPTFNDIISRALIAGLVAGILLAVYTWAAVEPTIDQAIALEEALAELDGDDHEGHSHDDEDALFSRSAQVLGGMAATVIYSVAVAGIFGTTFAAVRHRFGHLTDMGRSVVLAAVAFGTVGLLPGITYPANPPAVGDPDTVGERSLQWVAIIVIGLIVAVALVKLSGRLRQRLDHPTRWLVLTAVTAAVYGLVVFLTPTTPDTIDLRVPAELVWDFRVRSIGGLALTWATIGLVLGWSLDRLTGSDRMPDPEGSRPTTVTTS